MPMLRAIDLASEPALPVRFELLRAGHFKGRTSEHWIRHPFTLIGQACGNAIRFEVEGQGVVRIPRGGGYVLSATAHYRSILPPGERYAFKWLHANVRLLQALDLFRAQPVPVAQPVSVGRAIGRTVDALLDLPAPDPRQAVARAARIQALGLELLDAILAAAPAARPADAQWPSLRRVAPVLRFMEERMAEPLSKEDLAAALHLSESRFHELFMQALNLPPMKYLQDLRLKRAQQWLWTTEDPVAEIGRRCGFADAFHFSRIFKANFGASPRAYRHQARRMAAWEHLER